MDEGTSGYCQARARLPWDILPRLRCAAAARAERAAQLWRGLRVKVIDGTSTSAPDTAKTQRPIRSPADKSPAAASR